MTGRDVTILQRLLATEHGVIWAYGVLGARLDAAGQAAARQAEDAHRARRDTLRAQIRARGGDPVAAAAAYRLPVTVDGEPSALALAAVLEDDVATACHTALGGTGDTGLRRLCVATLQEAAVRAARWRALAAPTEPATVAFPGAPPPSSRPAGTR